MTESELTASIQDLADSNPALSASLQQLLDSGAYKDQVAFMAVFDGGSGIVGSANLSTSPGPPPLQDLSASIKGGLDQMGATGVNITDTTYAGHPGLLVEYRLALTMHGKPVTLSNRSYVITDGVTTYLFFVQCGDKDPTECLAGGDAMAGSIATTP